MSVQQLAERLNRELKWNNADVDQSVLAKSMKDAGIGERFPESITRAEGNDKTQPQIKVERPITIASPVMNPFLRAVNDNDGAKNVETTPVIIQERSSKSEDNVQPTVLDDYALESTQQKSVTSLTTVANELANVATAVQHVDMDISKEMTQKNVLTSLMDILDSSRQSTQNILRVADISETELKRLEQEMVKIRENTGSLLPIEDYEKAMVQEFASLHNVLRDGYTDLTNTLTDLTNAIEMLGTNRQPIEFPFQEMRESFFNPFSKIVGNLWKEMKDQTLSPFAKMRDKINSSDAFVGPRRWDNEKGDWVRDKLADFDANRLARDTQPIVAAVMMAVNLVKKFSLFGAALLAASAGADAYLDPAKVTAYFDSFQKLWLNSIQPTLQYLQEGMERLYTNAILPLVSSLQVIGEDLVAWWNSEGQNAFLVIGGFVNDTLIYFIGSVLPGFFTIIGQSIKSIIELTAALISNVKTVIDGFQEFDLKKIGEGLLNIGQAIIDAVLNMMNAQITGIIRIFNLEDMIDMKDGENFFESIKRHMDNLSAGIVNWIGNLKDGAVAWINSLNPAQTIVDALTSLMKAIIEMIPSYDDMAKYINGMIDTWSWIPQTLRDSMKLGTATPGFDTEGYRALRERDEMIKPVVTSKAVQDKYSSSMLPMFQQVYQDNRVIDASTNVTGGGTNNSGRVHVLPSTRPEESLYDKALLRPPGFWSGASR